VTAGGNTALGLRPVEHFRKNKCQQIERQTRLPSSLTTGVDVPDLPEYRLGAGDQFDDGNGVRPSQVLLPDTATFLLGCFFFSLASESFASDSRLSFS
jgi:hypothetical protein